MEKITPQVESIFCDDIRQEIGGKITLVGIYADDLILESFPLVVSKLGISVKVVVPNEYADQVLLSINKGDEVFAQVPPPKVEAATADASPSLRSFQVLRYALVFSPVEFLEPCELVVCAEINGQIYSGHGLRVVQRA